MQMNDNIEFPVRFSTWWSLSSAGKGITTYYNEWPEGSTGPYSGGFGWMAWDTVDGKGHGGAKIGTNDLWAYWVGPGQVAFQATDSNAFATIGSL